MAFYWWKWRRTQPPSDDEYAQQTKKLREKSSVPAIWLFGKTGSGKSSVIRYLTGAEDATIGEGYRPETKTSRRFDFPDSLEPLMTFNPAKILAYPLWRKSGRAKAELQNEVIRALYQRYLRQLGFYLIEMYSGRRQGGSQRYRSEFGQLSTAVRALDNPAEVMQQLRDVTTTIAVMGNNFGHRRSLLF